MENKVFSRGAACSSGKLLVLRGESTEVFFVIRPVRLVLFRSTCLRMGTFLFLVVFFSGDGCGLG